MSKKQGVQQALLETIDKLVDIKLSRSNKTTSQIGIVTEPPRGYEIFVEINKQIYECYLPEHLHTWIQEEDVVYVQDLYDNGGQKVVVGKSGETQKSPTLVFYDEEKNKNISGRDGIFEEADNEAPMEHTRGTVDVGEFFYAPPKDPEGGSSSESGATDQIPEDDGHLFKPPKIEHSTDGDTSQTTIERVVPTTQVVVEKDTPVTEWEINHNLNKYPCVTFVDTEWNLVLAGYKYINKNKIKGSFAEPFTGKAIFGCSNHGTGGQIVVSQENTTKEWLITHNLNKYPCVTFVDEDWNLVFSDVQYMSKNQIKVRFMQPFTGRAIFN